MGARLFSLFLQNTMGPLWAVGEDGEAFSFLFEDDWITAGISFVKERKRTRD